MHKDNLKWFLIYYFFIGFFKLTWKCEQEIGTIETQSWLKKKKKKKKKCEVVPSHSKFKPFCKK